MNEKKPEPEEVTRIRKLLEAWDKHILTASEFELLISDPFKNNLFELMRAGQEYGEARAGCFNEKAPPTIKVDVEFEIFPGGFWMRPKK